MNTAVHFSSATDQWSTPVEFFKALDEEFHFMLDVCADKQNRKCAHFFSEVDDGLKQAWNGACWMNPPYGREIGKWVEKARRESVHRGATVVCLLPARTDTKWFHDHCTYGEIRFIKGRLKFGDAKASAPFPSMIVVFRPPSRITSAVARF